MARRPLVHAFAISKFGVVRKVKRGVFAESTGRGKIDRMNRDRQQSNSTGPLSLLDYRYPGYIRPMPTAL
jgi:hypothetical protein